MKRKTSKEVIEDADTKVEHAWIKFGGKPPIDVTKSSDSSRVYDDREKIKKLKEEYGNRKYTIIHTHPMRDKKYTNLPDPASLPSPTDLNHLLMDNDEKAMVISQVDPNTQEELGRLYFLKTKKTPPAEEIKGTLQYKMDLNVSLKNALNSFIEGRENTQSFFESLSEFADKYGLDYNFVPHKDVGINSRNLSFVKVGKLEQKITPVIAIAGLGAGIFFISSNITGNVIGNLTNSSSNIIGAVLLVAGLVGSFLYLRKK